MLSSPRSTDPQIRTVAQGMGVRVCASESRPVAGADLTGPLMVRIEEKGCRPGSARLADSNPGGALMGRYYDGTPGRTLVRCPDCGREADETLGGDHGGTCEPPRPRPVVDGPAVVLAAARRVRFLSINSLRSEFVAAGIPETRRGPAFGYACKRGWIEHVGYEPSTDPATKKHHVKVYRSLRCPGAAAESIEGR